MPNHKDLRLKIIKEIHDQLTVGHFGMEKILNMTHRHYYWPCIQQIIKQYIQNCYVCRRAKIARDMYNGLFQPLLVPKKLWVNIIIDFVTGLPKCHIYGQIYDVIFIVIDRLLKKHYYILCTEKKQKNISWGHSRAVYVIHLVKKRPTHQYDFG